MCVLHTPHGVVACVVADFRCICRARSIQVEKDGGQNSEIGDTVHMVQDLPQAKPSILSQLRGTVVFVGITFALVFAVVVLPVVLR